MGFCSILLTSVVVIFVLIPFVGYEGSRLYKSYQTCLQTWEDNQTLLRNPICQDHNLRSIHGANQEAACRIAADQNIHGPMTCAARAWWLEGELHHLWRHVSESHWLLLGSFLGAVAIVASALVWSWQRNHDRRLKRDMWREIMDLRFSQSLPPPPSRSYYAALENGDEYDDDYLAPHVRRRRQRMRVY